jgi:hypothetical protein
MILVWEELKRKREAVEKLMSRRFIKDQGVQESNEFKMRAIKNEFGRKDFKV